MILLSPWRQEDQCYRDHPLQHEMAYSVEEIGGLGRAMSMGLFVPGTASAVKNDRCIRRRLYKQKIAQETSKTKAPTVAPTMAPMVFSPLPMLLDGKLEEVGPAAQLEQKLVTVAWEVVIEDNPPNSLDDNASKLDDDAIDVE